MKTNSQITKKIQIQQVYNGQECTAPDGYEFHSLYTHEGYIHAIFLQHGDMKEVEEKLTKLAEERIESHKKSLSEQTANQIGEMKLYKEFSDIITKFPLGSIAYYYKEYTRYGDDAKLDNHIDGINIKEVTLSKTRIMINELEEYSEQLEIKAWEGKFNPKILYKTKEEAIAGNKAHHEAKMEKLKLDRENAVKATEERKKKEEEEILRKAEEIKAKSNPLPQ